MRTMLLALLFAGAAWAAAADEEPTYAVTVAIGDV